MAKELPYFKFEPNEWQSGMIQLCSLESKGLFMELCSLYWSRLGNLPYALALQKLCMGNASALQELEKTGIYTVENDQIFIKFLDEQLGEFEETAKKRAKAANKRWSNASALQVQCKSNAIREEKRREEKKREYKKTPQKEKQMITINDEYNLEDPDLVLVFDGVVRLTCYQFETLLMTYAKKEVDKKITALATGIHNKNKRYLAYKDHYRTLLNWLKADGALKPSRAMEGF